MDKVEDLSISSEQELLAAKGEEPASAMLIESTMLIESAMFIESTMLIES